MFPVSYQLLKQERAPNLSMKKPSFWWRSLDSYCARCPVSNLITLNFPRPGINRMTLMMRRLVRRRFFGLRVIGVVLAMCISQVTKPYPLRWQER